VTIYVSFGTKLWHKRLGNLHYGAFPLLSDMVVGILNFKVERTRVCEKCTLNKHAKTTFSSSEHKSRRILDLVHSNVCGPMSSALLTSNIYYVSSLMILRGKPGFIL
jgi:hypothetical protein